MALTVLSEETLQRIEEAQHVADDDCLSWHKHCNAECCRMFRVAKLGLVRGGVMQIRMVLDQDRIWYYKLHGMKYAHGILYIPVEFIEEQPDGSLLVRRKCDFLQDDLRCAGHPTNKPRLCQRFTLETARSDTSPAKVHVTGNCLFRYKILAEGNNGGQSKS